MSGSTIGGVVGAAIGFYFGGPSGAQAGWMIGSAVGGYVDPDVIKGPELKDPQQQTSAEGVPRPVIYGTDAVMGNVIQCQSVPTRHKHRERTGKGGPIQETNTYTRTAAIRICEAAPLGGEMKLRRVWMNGKLALDRTGTGTIDAESAKLLGQLTFYSGSETQLPDPDLESLPAGDGGGVGNVPAYRGTCYVVLRNVDVTQPGGALPQFLWEVSSDAEESVTGDTQWLCASQAYFRDGTDNGTVWTGTPYVITPPGASSNWASSSGLARIYQDGSEVLVTGDGGLSGGVAVIFSPDLGENWQTVIGASSAASDGSACKLAGNWYIARGSSGTGYMFDGSTTTDTGYEFECVATDGDSLYTVDASNLIVRSPDGTIIRNTEEALSQVNTMAYGNGVVGIANVQGSVSTWNMTLKSVSSALADVQTHTNPFPTAASSICRVQYVESIGTWIITLDDRMAYGATLDDLTLSPHVFPGTAYGFAHDGEKLLVCGNGPWIESSTDFTNFDSLTVSTITDGNNLQALIPLSPCDPPAGAIPIPDSPGFYLTLDNEVVGCGPSSVTPNTVYLAPIVADFCERVGVTDYDVSALATIPVRGFSVKQPADAAGCIQALQAVYFFDFPEWGNSGETGTTLRAVLRGGASAATITDDDLVDTDDDETTRAQQVEFPRKLNLIAPDPESNYETIKQTSERESENVKATGEITVSTSVVMTRDECARVAEVMHKVAWEQALGTMKCELPEEYTRLVPSDIITRDGRRTRIDKTILGDGTIQIEATRDRARAYLSNATGSDQIAPPVIGSMRGPTMFQGLNVPRLRSADIGPGMYIGVCGRLPGWSGCDLYLSVDGGVSEQMVATIIDPSIMGYLAAGIGAADEPLAIKLWNDDELDSVTSDQLAARMNAFAVTTDAVSEIGQFQTPTDTGDREWDLTDLTRALLGTTAASHMYGDDFILLDGSLLFLPIDSSHAGKTLIFRPVTRGTDIAENATYSVLYAPQFTGAPDISFLLDESDDILLDESGAYLQD